MEVLHGKYKITDKLGKGAFGTLYKGQNIRTKEWVAIKVEPIHSNMRLLKNESTVYQYLRGVRGVPSVKWFGKDDVNYYMVLPLLGTSLQELKHKYTRLSLKMTLQIGVLLLQIIKQVHEKGLIHRDIKPDNFLFGLNNNNEKLEMLHIIDFGFCKPYVTSIGEHVVERKVHNLIGSRMYASVSAHTLNDQSRRDDLESIGYLLIYLYLGHLSWQNCVDEKDIIELKKNILNDDLPDLIVSYMRQVKRLSFTETPKYTSLLEEFKREISSI